MPVFGRLANPSMLSRNPIDDVGKLGRQTAEAFEDRGKISRPYLREAGNRLGRERSSELPAPPVREMVRGPGLSPRWSGLLPMEED